MKGQNKQNHNQDYLAAGLITLSSIIYLGGFIYSNQRKLHPLNNAMARGLMLFLLSYVFAYFKGIDLSFGSSHNLKWQTIRNGIMVVQALFFNWSMYYLPLPIAFTINTSSPLFIAIWDLIFYGIKLNSKQVFWLFIAFVGVILTINGNQIIAHITDKEQNTHTSFQHYLSRDPWMLTFVGVVFTIATCAHGFGSVMTKKLKNTNSIQINYFQSIMVIFISSSLAPFAFNDTTYNQMTMEQLGWTLLFTGLPTALGGFCYITALTITKNYAMISPFMFTGIVFGYVVSVFRYNQQINFLCLTGSIGIVVSVLAIMYYKDTATK